MTASRSPSSRSPTAAAFLAFSRHPADALVLEVGLGGKYDATNVIARPRMTIITPVGLDHQPNSSATSLAGIAAEKAGIIKAGRAGDRRPAGRHAARCHPAPRRSAGRAGLRCSARISSRIRNMAAWSIRTTTACSICRCRSLVGRHQIENAAVAIAGLAPRGRRIGARDDAHRAAALRTVEWPARLQRLTQGPLSMPRRRAPKSGSMAATIRMAPPRWRAPWPIWKSAPPKPLYLICGMLRTKDAVGFLAAFRGLARHVVDRRHRRARRRAWAPARFTIARARRGLDAAPGRRSGRRDDADRRPDARLTPANRPAAHPHLRLALSRGTSAGGERLSHKENVPVVIVATPSPLRLCYDLMLQWSCRFRIRARSYFPFGPLGGCSGSSRQH